MIFGIHKSFTNFVDKLRQEGMNATTSMEKVQDTSKITRRAVLIDDQLADMISRWASLDLQPTEEFEFEDPCSDRSSDGCDRNEESKLPPPRPYFERHMRAPASTPMPMQGVFLRVKSDPITQMCGAPTSSMLMQSRGMTQSMPNLHSSRSLYNRGIGYSVLSSATERGGQPEKHALRARVEEFDALLEAL